MSWPGPSKSSPPAEALRAGPPPNGTQARPNRSHLTPNVAGAPTVGARNSGARSGLAIGSAPVTPVLAVAHRSSDREWLEVSPGHPGFTGHAEAAAIFAPGSRALVDASAAAIKRAATNSGEVLKPLDPTASGVAGNPAWPGEGQYLFAVGGIADANYIAGPTYLLNWGISTVDKLNHHAIRAHAIAFTEMILRLGRTPRDQLTTYTL